LPDGAFDDVVVVFGGLVETVEHPDVFVVVLAGVEHPLDTTLFDVAGV
jgi:hypothetical protein